jgi:hypothetical protein
MREQAIYWGLLRRDINLGIYLDCLMLLMVHSLHFFGGSHLYPYLESQSNVRRVRYIYIYIYIYGRSTYLLCMV